MAARRPLLVATGLAPMGVLLCFLWLARLPAVALAGAAPEDLLPPGFVRGDVVSYSYVPIGVDVYHYWFHLWSPFDPADLSIPCSRVRAHSDEWQRLRTKYYPEGLTVRVCTGSADTATWVPECWNDTHALMNAIDFAGAGSAMMWYIGVSGQLGPSAGQETTYTTPIETMEAYYGHLKAGRWVALAWWVFGNFSGSCHGGLEYYDRTLVHHTPAQPEGEPYSAELLEYWQREYVALKRRMFNDVVYNQFHELNGPGPKP